LKENKYMTTKKPPPGFSPIDFKLAGKIMLPLGVVMVLLWLLGFFMAWDFTPIILLYIGLLDLLVSCYLIFLVPKK
jgi:hypothetical protein